MFNELIAEIREEAVDFFEDFGEIFFRRNRRFPAKEREIVINGVLVKARPAYLFAERIDNLLKLVFGLSICLSAISSTFLGFIKLSDLLEVLIFSWWGRILMIVIGLSYLITGIWKLAHINKP